MRSSTIRYRIVAALAVLATWILPRAVYSQTDPQYRYFIPNDTVFRIGATNVNHARMLRDSLKIEFSRIYNIGDIDTLRRIVNNPQGWYEESIRDFYLQADSIGFKVIGGPPRLGSTEFNSRVQENYAATSYSIQTLTFMEASSGAQFDTTMKGFYLAPIVSSLGTPTNMLMARGPRYTADFAFYAGERAIYKDLQQERGMPNRSMHFRISFAMRADSMSILMPDTTLLAYAVLYRRSRTGQDISCKCQIYEPFDTLLITKGYYNDSADFAGDGLKEVGWTLNFVRDTVVYKGDSTVITTVPVWQNGTQIGTRDSVFTTYFYNADTVIGCPCMADTTSDVTSGNRRTIVREHHVERHHIPLSRSLPDDWLYGPRSLAWGDASSGTTCQSRCDSILNSLNSGLTPRGAISQYIEASDFDLRFYSTRRVPVSFLRSRINNDLYDSLRQGKLDNYIRADVDDIYQDTLFRKLFLRVTYTNEPIHPKIRPGAVMARKIKDMMAANGDTSRQLWANPPGNFDGYRLLSEDFDSTRVKTVQIISRQSYQTIGGTWPGDHLDAIPIRYANPDSMSVLALNRWYRAQDTMTYNGVTSIGRAIAYNTTSDYNDYTNRRQFRLGKFSDRTVDTVSNVVGPLVPNLARAVHVAKFKYSHLGPPCPVWNAIQDMAWIKRPGAARNEMGGGYNHSWDYRPVTPEELTVQAWLSLNCGANGILYDDASWDGASLSLFHWKTGDHSSEYDTLSRDHPSLDNPRDTLMEFPKMWTGFRSRFAAAARVNTALRKLDTIVHLTDLVFEQNQMSLHDINQTFTGMPLIDTVYTVQARRYDTSTSMDGKYLDSTAVDPRSATYLELTHFKPGTRDTFAVHRSAQYLLLTNRRTWPVDRQDYSTRITDYWPSSTRKGYGAIDVRRPVIVLKNTSNVIADSFLVEKVLDTAWKKTVGVGQPLQLAWLEPGWGEMYRVTPIPSGASKLGVGFNNAVHSENPSTDGQDHDRTFVYERDSAIYLRVLDTNGLWSTEVLLSNSVDQGKNAPGQRKADNVNPAVATVRNARSDGKKGTLVVWERRDNTTGNSTVQVYYLQDMPTRTAITGSTLFANGKRFTISTERTSMTQPMAPAVVGLDSGWVIGWGTVSGIELAALRDTFDLDTALHRSVTIKTPPVTALTPICDPISLESVSLYPTLAHRPYRRFHVTGDTILYQIAHLGWQQGIISSQIIFNPLGVRFAPGARPLLVTTDNEHVTFGLPACSFRHPSISVDSLRVGIAFESNYLVDTVVTLRFRDSVATQKRYCPSQSYWLTPFYEWGPTPDQTKHARRPSLTHFPRLRVAVLAARLDGALTWYETMTSGEERMRLYRYGWTADTTMIPHGSNSSMTLVPYRSTVSPFLASSVYYRAEEPRAFQRSRAVIGGPSWYFGTAVENTPAEPSDLFNAPRDTHAVVGQSRVYARKHSCPYYAVHIGLRHEELIPSGGYPKPKPKQPDLPPSFFVMSADSSGVVRTLDEGMIVTRTSDFEASMEQVRMRRIVKGNDSVVSWLNQEPHDSTLNTPADIKVVMELIRSANGNVLWRSDTVSVRAVAASTDNDLVEVPVSTNATPGEDVYIRLRSFTTAGLDYDLAAGFVFVRGSSGGLSKLVLPESQNEAPEEGNTALGLRVIPNPMQGSGEIQVQVLEAGTVSLTLYDMFGRAIRQLPSISCGKPGQYMVKLDAADLPSGLYTIHAEMENHRMTKIFSVIP